MDEEADFEAFVRARWRPLLRTAYLLTGDLQLAEDLLQETLARSAGRWGAIRRRGTPEAYVRKVMYTRSVDAWRWRRRQPVVAEPRDTMPGPDRSAEVDGRLVLRQALARLTPKQRAVLVLRFYEDRSEAQAADLLGCSVGTVKSQTHSALSRLRLVAPELAEAFGRKDSVEAP